MDELNGRDLSGETYCCIMIDGIEKARSHVMVALGFTTKGSKRILGFHEGATENSEVVKDLIQSLIDRGLCTTPCYPQRHYGLSCASSRHHLQRRPRFES
ncbi:MAG: transposase, partial [Phycisphaerales bacterium]